jgi:hypothetical protein
MQKTIECTPLQWGTTPIEAVERVVLGIWPAPFNPGLLSSLWRWVKFKGGYYDEYIIKSDFAETEYF